MTTTSTTAARLVPLLDGVDRALIAAHHRLTQGPAEERSHRALIALAEAAFDALVDWESGTERQSAADDSLAWRAELDELRVQAARTDAQVQQLVARVVAEVDELARLTAGPTAR